MRHIPIDKAVGSFVAEDIYDLAGRILIKAGSKLSDNYASRMKQIGYASVYIKDTLWDRDIKPLIPSELRNATLNGIRNLHRYIRDPQSKGIQIHETIESLFKLGLDVQYQLNDRRSHTIDYTDIKSSMTYTYEHCVSVAVLSFLLAKSLGFAPHELNQVFIGGLFHDIGMAYIDETVFMKNGKLNLEEFVKIKEHPQKGYEFVKDLAHFSAYTKVIVLQHHEKLDGTGYPNKLLGKDIHPFAKMVSVCDIYDAMTSDRPYSKAVEPVEALEYLDSASSTQLDAVSTMHFIRLLMPYPEGTYVVLSDKRLGIVIENNDLWPLRPKVQLVDIAFKKTSSEVVDLVSHPNLTIQSVFYERI